MREGYHEISLGVPADVTWNALVAPGRRDWYYLLTAEGEFAEGKQIRWLDRTGHAAEESEVVEMNPPARLALRTRFTFAPLFAKEDPHSLTWELTPEGSGCRVRMSWRAAGPVADLFESEGESLIRGLRLAVDPEAQAEIARLRSARLRSTTSLRTVWRTTRHFSTTMPFAITQPGKPATAWKRTGRRATRSGRPAQPRTTGEI